ncbi:hypothetical protein ACL03H_22840 [Saccharopolyspora sp. MS10]|uniref:hypothetical protein n=1 Tax=Saccharopolyspora sp. MS10 TaxID=3385973 RepID=UPI0039A2402A
MSEPEAAPLRVRDLIVRSQGSTVLILHSSGGDETELRVFGAVPVAPGDGLVLAAADAVRASGFRTALRHASRMAVVAAARARASESDSPRLWLAVSGAGRPDGRGRCAAQKMAREFSVEVYAPDGPITFVAGGSIFTGADHHGWVRFPSGGGAGELRSARYPQPPWETLLPRGAVHDGGLHAEPVPAGLAASATAEAAAAEVWHAVAVSAEHPRVVLGSPQGPSIAAHQVAALLRRFPHSVRERMQLVPASPETSSPQWLGKLAALVGHDVVVATGLIRHGLRAEFTFVPDQRGGPSWLPFAALLRYSRDGRVDPVLAGAPPRGWRPAGPLRFRWGGTTEPHPTPHELVAKVVPAGLALLPAPQAGIFGAADRLAFEPDQLTVALGWPCTPLPEGIPVALHRLLSGLDAEQLARVRLLVLGIASEAMREQVRAAAGPLADRLRFPAVLPAEAGSGAPAPGLPVPDELDLVSEPVTGEPAPAGPAPAGPAAVETAPAAEEPEDGPAPLKSLATRRIPLTGLLPAGAGIPVAVRAGSAAEVPRISPEVPLTPLAGAAQLPKRQPGASPLSRQSRQRRERLNAAAAKRAEKTDSVRVTQLATATAATEPAAPATGQPFAVEEPAAAPADRTTRLPASALRRPSRRAGTGSALVPAPALPAFLAERPSSEQQRAAFAQHAGTDFESGSEAVRAALAGSDGEVAARPEADLVAVHLYLGSGEFGAVSVNRVLRGRERDEFGDHAACLMSGLRGLPVHGGPVHRLVELDALEVYEPGMLVSEPGFLSASAEAVSAEGCAQVLLWSRGARDAAPLGGPGAEVIFPAGARFAVLDVDRGVDGPALLLRELDPAEEPGDDPATDAEHLELMRLARKQRRTAASTAPGDATARLIDPVGFVPDELPEPAAD